jgi:hypothetical protein
VDFGSGDGDREADIVYGYMDCNGNGSCSVTFTDFDSDGEVGSGNFNGTYGVNSDGSFFLNRAGNPATFVGYISRDANRNFIILTDGYADDHINIGIVTAVKTPAALLQVADLNGAWRFRDLELRDFEASSTDASACAATLNCNNGGWDGVYSCFDSDGSTDAGPVSGTYSWNGANNAFDFFITGEPGVAFSAYLSRDKQILIMTRGVIATDGEIGQWIATALKENSAKTFTNADLNATYWFVTLEFQDYESNEREASSRYGEVDFHGDGTWDGTSTFFDSDGSTGSLPISGNYSVNANGSFSLIVTSLTPNATLSGDISSNSDALILTRGELVADVEEPTISVVPNSLSNSCKPGNDAASQTFEIWNSGGEAISYNIACDAEWLTCAPVSGTSTGEHDTITVDYFTSSLSPGLYNAAIAIYDPNADNSPEIPVTLTVSDKSPIYRFWSNNNRSHFYTMSETEKYNITVNYSEDVWKYERIAWFAYSAQEAPAEAKSVYRFWSTKNKVHFYTISETEKDNIIATYPEDVWKYERIAYYAYAPGEQPEGAKPVYRFWSPKNRRHFYTISENEKDNIIANYPEEVWRYERIAWYAFDVP